MEFGSTTPGQRECVRDGANVGEMDPLRGIRSFVWTREWPPNLSCPVYNVHSVLGRVWTPLEYVVYGYAFVYCLTDAG